MLTVRIEAEKAYRALVVSHSGETLRKFASGDPIRDWQEFQMWRGTREVLIDRSVRTFCTQNSYSLVGIDGQRQLIGGAFAILSEIQFEQSAAISAGYLPLRYTPDGVPTAYARGASHVWRATDGYHTADLLPNGTFSTHRINAHITDACSLPESAVAA